MSGEWTPCKTVCLEGGERPDHLISAFAGLVNYQKKRQMGEISLLSLTIVGWLIVGHVKAQGLPLGPVLFESRKTAFANFQTA